MMYFVGLYTDKDTFWDRNIADLGFIVCHLTVDYHVSWTVHAKNLVKDGVHVF
jgi:hypothetical protein